MKLKRILASILCFAMVLSAMGTVVFAEESTIENTTTAPEDVLIVGSDYSTVYYGGIPWRVLSKDYSSDSTNEDAPKGILLLSEHAMANGIRYNAHYSNNAWSSSNKAWASAMVMPWDDERNPHYEDNIANGTKTDDSSGGYLTSDIRLYLTGGDAFSNTYETFRAFAYYAESWPASWTTFADRNGQGWRYYTRNIVTDTEPQPGVTYFVKGDFELSNHGRDCAIVNGVTVPGMYALTPADWAEDTWYTLDENSEPVLMTEWPEGATTVNAYYDQAGYSIADVSNGFEDGVTYYTFVRYLENECPKVIVDGEEVAMGDHLAALFKWVGYSVPEMTTSDHNDAIVNERFVAGLSASENNFASDMGFSEIEKAAVLPTSGHGYNRGSGVNRGWSGSIGSTYGDRLDGDTYFLLSGDEVYTYLTAAGHTTPATHLDGTTAGDLWTRSWGRADIQTVITYANNAVNWYKGANTWWQSIRPAFNLNPDAVVAYVPVADNAYRMVMLDESKTDFVVESVKVDLTVAKVKYSGAVTGENEYISCIAKDENGKSYYLRSEAITETEGTVEFDLSTSGASGALSLYFINETCDVEDEKATTTAKNISETFGATIIYVTPDEDNDDSNDATIQAAVDTVSGNEGEFVIVVNGDRTEDVEVIDYADGQQIAIAGKVDEIPVINGRFVVNGNDKNETGFILKNIIFNNNGAMMFARNAVYTVDVSNITNSLIENVVISDMESGISFIGVGDAVISDTTIDVSGNAVYVGEGANVSITSGTYKGAIEVATGGTLSITGGSFSHNVSAYVADGYELTRTADGYVVVEDSQIGDPGRDQADSISVVYELESEIEGEKVYNVIVKANDDDVINELASVDLTFAFTETPIANGDITFAVAPAAGFAITEHDSTVREELTKRYMFNYNGVDGNYEGTANEIVVATITVTGYGEFKIATADVDTNIVNATTLYDNLVDSYTAAGATDDDATTGALDISGKIDDGKIAVPDRNLAITIDFPNAIIDNVIAYQDMKVVISGGDLTEDITIELGTDAVATELDIYGKEDAGFVAEMISGSYVINVTDALTLNNAYTVTVSGAGYRTARYTVTMTEDKTLRFWNNVMDEAQVVEIGKDSSAVNVTFLAGDIVKDNKINIYDLSAVVSYFGTETNTTSYDAYAKYDLNRDGVIDSKDVAYVLVSWDK